LSGAAVGEAALAAHGVDAPAARVVRLREEAPDLAVVARDDAVAADVAAQADAPPNTQLPPHGEERLHAHQRRRAHGRAAAQAA
jgi:hypothetical protein